MRLILYIAALLFFFPVFAQQKGELLKESQSPQFPFTVTHYGMEQGLPQNQVSAIIEKKDGMLLVATFNGIVEYDGEEFHPFSTDRDYYGNPHYQIFYHEATKQLFGTELKQSFNLISPGYSKLADLVAATISDNTILGIDAQGNIWTASVSSKKFQLKLRTGIKEPFSIFKDGNELLVSDYEDLWRVNLSTGKKTHVLHRAFHKFSRNPFDGKIYGIGMNEPYAVKIDGMLTEEISLPVTGNQYNLSDIAFVSPDVFYITSYRGLIESRNGQSRLFGTESGIPEQLYSIHYSKANDCLFIGTVQQGLFKLQYKNCYSYSATAERYIPSMVSVFKTPDAIVGASSEKLVFSLKNEVAALAFDPETYISSMTFINGSIYAGTWGVGVNIYQNQKLIKTILKDELSGQGIRAVFRDSKGMIWIGNQKGIACGKSPGTIRLLNSEKINTEISCIYELSNGNICLGGSTEVYILDEHLKITERFGKKQGLNCREIRAFYEDKDKKLWIGTYGGGLYCYEKGKLTALASMKNYLLGSDAFVLQPDGKNNLLITSNSGLRKININDLNDFYHRRCDYLIPFYYGNASGILNTEFNGGTQSNAVDQGNGKFVFSNIQGFVEFTNPNRCFRKLKPHFSYLYINDTTSDLNNHVFSRLTQTMRFRFSCPNFNKEYNIYYQYKLTGPESDGAWSKPQKNGDVSFNFLPPGKYKMSIRAIDAFNDHSPFTETFAFEIEPYFYETGTFYFLAILAALLTVVIFMRYRYLRIIRKRDREDQINNTILELKLSAIQSKMDPHFIFNSLNTIMYLLDAQKYAETEELLHDFSMLLRRFLEISDKTFISVREELEIIQLYLLIEQRRSNNSFDFGINYPDKLSAKSIPTMLIQPLVENAVKHGVSHSTRNCTISISILEQGNDLHIVVEDNGIGRKRSSEINKSRRNHVSKGMSIVEDKIAVMLERYNMNITLEISDIMNSRQTGTRVHLTITDYDKMSDNRR